MTQALKRLAPANFKAVGTSGLEKEEIRALLHRLNLEADLLKTSRDAQSVKVRPVKSDV